jgi:hypothetical protein
MQGPTLLPTEYDVASMPTEHVPTTTGPDGPFLSAGNLKAAKRTFPFDLKIGETIQLALPQPPQAEDTRETKRRRLWEPFPTSEDEATTDNTSHDTTVALPPTDADAAAATTVDADSDPVMDVHPNLRATGVTSRWTQNKDKDKKLKDAMPRTHGDKNWEEIAALAPGRTRDQCRNRWHTKLNSNIDATTARAGQWTAEEDKKMKDAVPTQGGKDWEAIAALFPGRTKQQCCNRWHNKLVFNIDPTMARVGKWTEDENKKLREAVEAHGANNWDLIAALVPGRTERQCRKNWHKKFSNIDPAAARTGKWTAEEDEKLKGAVRAHSGKNWKEITALFPGRTKRQCQTRWHTKLNFNIDATTAREGQWTAEEDKKMKDAVPTQGGKDWEAIAALFPGRTRQQCCNRWHNKLVFNIDPTTARVGKWTEDENKKLREAVEAHGANNWDLIAALVPSRTRNQCSKKWHNAFSNIDPATARTGHWTADEDKKLKDAVPTHGDKNWEEIAGIIPGRTRVQCQSRWHNAFSNIDPATACTGHWTADEDKKLTDAVPAQGDKNWEEIAVLVPGRTIVQCQSRWHYQLNSNIEATTARTGHWTADEDKKLKDAVPAQGDKNWEKIAGMIPGRTRVQCQSRWQQQLNSNIDATTVHKQLNSNIDATTARTGHWTADEDKKLMDAVAAQGDKDWMAIALLVSSRTNGQCHSRWRVKLKPSIEQVTRRTGKWGEDEDEKLKDAVRAHGGKNWKGIAALVIGRTREQCTNRWYYKLDPSIDPATARTDDWTTEEDEKLRDAVRAHGGKNWKEIAVLVPGRTEQECLNRWCDKAVSNIDPTTALTGKWTEDEDQELKDALDYARNKWK